MDSATGGSDAAEIRMRDLGLGAAVADLHLAGVQFSRWVVTTGPEVGLNTVFRRLPSGYDLFLASSGGRAPSVRRSAVDISPLHG